ncbi:MAG TPA: radical SAM protein [Anaerolineae bacterium]|nr:radical SAM protein [Caldilineae bacterium]HID35414.1 radical SAM protein [Anaerolineae bacterium]HIQ12462.1 radical SAM protein [Caldilineales bacterium]
MLATASHHHLTLSDGRKVHLRLNHEALTISMDELLIYTFDLAGRLVGAFDHGVNYRRGVDGRVLARWRDERNRRARRWLSGEEAEGLLARMREDVEVISKQYAVISDPYAVGDVLARALAFDYALDVRRFHQVYRPISILPPDQYQALVLQATEGCSFNTCTFCALYRDRPFRIKSPAEFESHVADALDFFGPGLSMRRSIFLADANALIIPQHRLLPLMTLVARAFPILPEDAPTEVRRAWLRGDPRAMTGVFAFVDGLSAERKGMEDFRAMRALGLRRVYIGLESGHEPLLTWLRKPSAAAEMVDAVSRMKDAGLHVGVIVLLGVGGHRFDQGHVEDTAAALNAMPLDGDDIIYFSPFQPDPAAPYLSIARAEGVDRPDDAFMDSQRTRILARLTLPPPPAGPKRAPYNLADFVY